MQRVLCVTTNQIKSAERGEEAKQKKLKAERLVLAACDTSRLVGGSVSRFGANGTRHLLHRADEAIADKIRPVLESPLDLTKKKLSISISFVSENNATVPYDSFPRMLL